MLENTRCVMPTKNDKRSQDARTQFFIALGTAYGFVLQMIAGLIVGYYGGRYVDRWLGTGQWVTVILMVLGVVAAFRSLFRRLGHKGPPH